MVMNPMNHKPWFRFGGVQYERGKKIMVVFFSHPSMLNKESARNGWHW